MGAEPGPRIRVQRHRRPLEIRFHDQEEALRAAEVGEAQGGLARACAVIGRLEWRSLLRACGSRPLPRSMGKSRVLPFSTQGAMPAVAGSRGTSPATSRGMTETR